MFNKILFASIALASLSSYADVDYSRCNFAAGLYGMRLDNDGQLQLSVGQKINSKSTNGNVEKYVIETDPTVFGGISNSTAINKFEVSLVKDDQGRVVKVVSGGDKLDKKSLENFKKFQLQMQLSGVVSTADFSNGNGSFGGGFGYGMGSYGDVPKNTLTQEPMYYVKNENGGASFLKLSQLNQKQRSEIGLSEDVYKAMKQKWKKDKKTVAIIEKGLKKLSEKSTPSYFLGQEAELDIKDGVCSPSKVSTRMFNSKDGSVQLVPTFTKEACEEVAKLHLKHREKLTKCDDANEEISQEIFKNSEKLKNVPVGMGGYGYPGMGLGYGGYGMGGFGYGSQSQLSMMKSQCDMMLGEFSFGMGISTPKEEKSSATPQ